MPDEAGRPYVYLAGPDVFYPDATKRARKMKRVLARRGMVGLFPTDNKLSLKNFADAKQLGLAIGNANEAMMLKADIIIANVQPWRGPEADDGTSYEIGFMTAHGKLIILHTNDMRPFTDRVTQDVYFGKVHRDGPFLRGDKDNLMVEDFPGFQDNLMLVNAAVNSIWRTLGVKPDPADVVQQDFRAAARLANQLWERRKTNSNRRR